MMITTPTTAFSTGMAVQVSDTGDQSLFRERLASLDRTGKRLARLIAELNEINEELDGLDQMLFVPGLPDGARQELLAEMDLAVGAYNHLRDAASESYRLLVLQRESCGFRNHQVLRLCYPIPELHETALETYEALESDF